MLTIKRAEIEQDLDDIHKIIQLSFITVANDLGFTKENAPTNPAYITLERVKESFKSGIEFYLALLNEKKVGCIAIEKDKNSSNTYFIERLGVLPEYRHNKIGRKLLEYSIMEIREKQGLHAGIAIVNENTLLKKWYTDYGFKEDRIKKFDHLPFTVCFMSLEV